MSTFIPNKNEKMKYLFIISTIFLSSIAYGQSLNVKTDNASVEFYFITKDVKGTMSGVIANINIDYSDLANSDLEGTVNVSTLDTKNEQRDGHLKNPDFFEIEKYPTMTFKASSIEMIDKQLMAKGELTIKDVSKEVVFNVSEEGESIVFKADIYTSDFGVDVKKSREDNKVEVIISIPLK